MKYLYTLVIAFFICTTAVCQTADTPAATDALDVKPDYPGGMKQFYDYVGKNFRTPELDKNMVAKILVGFVVEKDGSITDIKILKDPGYGMGAEAVRVLKACPEKWSAGYQNGKPVRSSFTLPIIIRIDSGNTGEEAPAPGTAKE